MKLTWRKRGFTLRLWDTHKRDWRGQTYLSYELKDGREVIFSGDGFSGSPIHSNESRKTVMELLGFLTLQPGDTDREYFQKYTPRQLEWCTSPRSNELRMLLPWLDNTRR